MQPEKLAMIANLIARFFAIQGEEVYASSPHDPSRHAPISRGGPT
jgi:hypothetical protein